MLQIPILVLLDLKLMFSSRHLLPMVAIMLSATATATSTATYHTEQQLELQTHTTPLTTEVLSPVNEQKEIKDESLALLQDSAPDANPEVIAMAYSALQCASAHGMESSDRLAVIDYSLPSTQPRLWVFDLESGTLLYREHVAHGRNSGGNMTTKFSNVEGSFASSLGLFRTRETYVGSNGYSMRMDGLEPGFNDQARSRAIVMHGAPYVDVNAAQKQGRLGRSLGCPAVREGVARQMIDTLKNGQFIFSYYPDPEWLSRSRYLNCTHDINTQLASNAKTSAQRAQ